MPNSGQILTGSYDYSLVALSVFISILASYAALDLSGRVTLAQGKTRRIWLIGGAFAMGLGIWSMHYVGMLALQLPVPVLYDWPTVGVSLVAAIAASAIALFVVSRRKVRLIGEVLGSILMGGGIASMHYIGMEAMRLPAMCQYSPWIVALSILIAVAISYVAIWLTFRLRRQTGSGGWKKAVSALTMGFAIPIMHYTGMAAATFTPAALSPDRLAHAVSISALGALGIIVVTSMVLAVVLITARLDRLLARQAVELEMSEQRYRRIVETTFDAFVGMDIDGVILDWNSKAEAIFGWARSQAVGKSLAQMLAMEGNFADKEENLRLLMASLQAALLKKPMQMRAVHRDGHEFPIEMTIVAIQLQIDQMFAVFVRDITEQVQATEKLKSSIAELENLKKALDQHAIVARTNTRGIITFANDKFCAISKYPREELIGMDHQVVSSNHHSNEFIENLWTTIKQGRTWKGEIKNRAKDGTEYWLSTTIVPLCDSEGRPHEYIAIRTDISELKRIGEELLLAKDKAEQASRSKSEFLANMSHEIRTPLNGIIGMTDLMLDTQIDAEQREYLETVKLSADSLLTVINDILDFSKIEAGKIDLESVDFDLRDCLESTLRILALRADQKGLELLCEVDPDVPELVRGDSTRLRQVITNLAGNSIKFTDHGEIALRIRVESKSAADYLLHFTVSDTGIGISPDKQKLIFAPFSQADSSTTRKYGGTGLGLTISTRLVQIMGGEISVESELGKGSQFHFTMRFGVAEAQSRATQHTNSLDIIRGAKVLIVDDNRTNRRILEQMLGHWEMRVDSAESGEQAIQRLVAARQQGDPYTLMLTDMHMPVMDGFTLAENVRQKSELSTATIMMLTSAGNRGDGAQCQKLGIAAYLLKPVRQNELREAIALSLSGKDQKETHGLITRYSLQDAVNPVRTLRVLLAEDNAVNQRLASRMLEKRGHHVTLARNGREAADTVQKSTFDLVLMDVQMPEMDGFEATAAIREWERLKGRRVPIIALTAHAMKGDKERCLAEGMDGYLTKPIVAIELEALLDKYAAERPPTVRATEIAGQQK
jgi:PAS domain S-box-containing protein